MKIAEAQSPTLYDSGADLTWYQKLGLETFGCAGYLSGVVSSFQGGGTRVPTQLVFRSYFIAAVN